ncbi:MAG: hypothetical protein ABI618_08795 [Nitrospirota bacterium]
MNALPGSTDEKWVIYWEREYSTAFAPERLKLDFHPHRPLMTNMALSEQREVAASGYKVIPDDCGPVRFAGQYGWLIRSPADCRIRRKGSGFEWQSPPIRPEEQLLGYKSFSGMYVDTILNSGFPKLYCGIRFYYPMQLGMMMKDLPNHFYYFPKRTFSIWEGIATQEYKVTPNDFLPDYAAFVTNFLIQLDPSTEEPTTILRGDPIGLVVPVLLPKHFTLQELKRTPEETSNA